MATDKGGEMYSGGYTGKVLRVDLTSKTYTEEPLPVEVAQDFIGGVGLHRQVPLRRGARRTATRSARRTS